MNNCLKKSLRSVKPLYERTLKKHSLQTALALNLLLGHPTFWQNVFLFVVYHVLNYALTKCVLQPVISQHTPYLSSNFQRLGHWDQVLPQPLPYYLMTYWNSSLLVAYSNSLLQMNRYDYCTVLHRTLKLQKIKEQVSHSCLCNI